LVELAEAVAVLPKLLQGTSAAADGRRSARATFHEYASLWLRGRVAEGIAENTRKDVLWQLSNHLLPFFGRSWRSSRKESWRSGSG
jgi:hypothetical protein